MSITDGAAGIIGAALVVALLNAILWPLLIRFALPFTVLTFGLGVLILNGLIVLLAGALDNGLTINGFWGAFFTALILSLVTTALMGILSIDDDAPWQRNVVGRQARRAAGVEPTDVPGLFFLEIDGLAHAVVQRAIRDGDMPTRRRVAARRHAPARLAGRPTGPRRPAPARPACCTATTTTCPRSAGGRRTPSARSSRTT